MTLEIAIVPCLSDNYAYLLRDTATGRVGLVDAPEQGPIAAALAERGWGLDLILITHHHDDHIAGVDALRDAFGAEVVGAAADRHRLPRLDRQLAAGDTVALGESVAEVIDVPGHTVGHIAYYFGAAGALFSADSLMVMGCGRLFEGTPQAMWGTLTRLGALPDATLVYSGHEYAESNLRFALSVDTDNPALARRAEDIRQLRAEGKPTVPARLDLERATNPFLRATSTEMKASVGLPGASDAEVFADLRHRKDNFR
jgi:hydroxyacylglutathione hydrolase